MRAQERLKRLLSPRALLDKAARALADARDLMDPGLRASGLDLEDRPSPEDGPLIERLLSAYRKSKAEQARVRDGPYAVGGAWAEDIGRRRAEWLSALDRGDAAALSPLLGNLLRNSGVAGLWTHGYFHDLLGGAGARRRFRLGLWRDLRLWRTLCPGEPLQSLAAPPVGNPWGLRVEGVLVGALAPRHHYYAARMRPLLAGPRRPVLCEIGGGFGGFGYYLLSQAQAPATYLDFDIPEIALVASYFLLRALPGKRTLLYGEAPLSGLDRAALEGFDLAVLPHFALRELRPGTIDGAFNAGSFSEMDYPTIEEYLRRLDQAGMGWLFHANSDSAVENTGGHVEVPCSRFPVPLGMSLLYKIPSGFEQRYREQLYQRRPERAPDPALRTGSAIIARG